MNRRRVFTPFRVVADSVTGLALFLLIAGVLAGCYNSSGIKLSDVLARAQAHPAVPSMVGMPTSEAWLHPTAVASTIPLAMIPTTTYPAYVFRNTDRTKAFLVLGAVFTLLFVIDMAFYRHLRAQYSRPRRRKRRH